MLLAFKISKIHNTQYMHNVTFTHNDLEYKFLLN